VQELLSLHWESIVHWQESVSCRQLPVDDSQLSTVHENPSSQFFFESGGQIALDPVQDSATSQRLADGLQTLPAFPAT
jgi:hypothetical protein